jgi:[ribosomal protein S18]-alanine N-acetyltransferase
VGDKDRRLKEEGIKSFDESGRGEEFQIVPMEEPDLEEVLTIEASSFSSPWTKEMFLNEFVRAPISWCFVAKPQAGQSNTAGHEEKVLGYICFWIIGDEMQIANIAVHPSWRRRGIGRDLLSYALNFGHSRGVRVVVLEVRFSNVGAQRLYRSLGFQVVGTRRGYYQLPPEDALVMARDLAKGGSWPKIS